mgnify:CR=1 FL=1
MSKINVNKHRKLSTKDYALWFASQVGATLTLEELPYIINDRNRKIIEGRILAKLKPVEEVVETPEDIPDSEEFPTDLTYDAMTLKELKEECKNRGLPITGTKSELALRLKRDDEGISESIVETSTPDEESAVEEPLDAPDEESAVTKVNENENNDINGQEQDTKKE